MPVSLVFGASGAIGRFLVPRLLSAGHEVVAISRAPHAAGHPRLRWIAGDLYATLPPLPDADAIFSAGPLDAFANWLAHDDAIRSPRIVAIGSQSAATKQASAEPAERALAERLLVAEQALANAADVRGAAWTVLRPTLIYGAGLDRTLTPIVRFAARWRVFPYIANARGLRQPVHADDLARACMDVLAHAHTTQRIYAVGGGERLPFGTMFERVRASFPFRTVALPIPFTMARAAAGIAARFPAFRAASPAAVRRLEEDLIVDHSAAIGDFGWSPRPFRPDASAWTPPPLA
jgi:nucleoside-diphosphate-sugar epimerase